MVRLEKIKSQLFAKLYESFLVDDDPLSDEAVWRSVFDYQWDKEEDYCGYAFLDDADEVIGMLGMIFSERWIDGSARKFCNLHTWWVREDHRGRSLALLRPVTKLTGYTITHFTPCDIVRAVTKRLGFQELSSQLKILLPMGFFSRKYSCESTLEYDEQEIRGSLTKVDKKIFEDHYPYGCNHVLIREPDQVCYLLYTYVVRHRLPYCHIQYMSNMDVFARNERVVRASLLKRHKARFVAVDARLVRDMKFPFSFDFWAPANALYKSSEVKPDQIDNLYSDVVFLKLTVLPDISHEIRCRAGRYMNWRKNR